MFNFLSVLLLVTSIVPFVQAQEMTLDVSMFPGFYVVMISAVIFLPMSIIATLYVFYRTFMRWKKNGYNQLSIAAKFPFYLAITDFLICTISVVNDGSTFANHKTLSGPICSIIGAVTLGLGTANLGLVGSLALVTYLRVCKNITFNFGRYDCKLFSVMFLIASVSVAISSREFGPTEWWCGTRPNSMVTPITLITIITTIVLVIAFCYFNILYAMHQVNHRLVGLEKEQRKTVKYESKVTKKIASYLLIFLIQWGSQIIVQFVQLAGVRSYWIDAYEGISFSLGGVGNAIQYIANEGWTKNQSTNASSDNDTNVTHGMANIEITVVKNVVEDQSSSLETIVVQDSLTFE